MTIDEAISLLKQYIDYDNPDVPDFYTMEEACKVAIKALEQEPCEDSISREATVKRLCQIAEFMNKKRDGLGSPYVMAALFIQDNKDEFPPVTSQPKKNIKALGEDIRICQKSITDKKVLIGFNMAVALCNKNLAEGSDEE